MRTRLVVLFLVASTLLLQAGCVRTAPVALTATDRAGVVRPEIRALAVLRAWDRRRASAYAAGDPQRLRRLYGPGSRAGARDVAALRGYAARGLVVEDLTVQVHRVRLVTGSPRLLRLRVREQVTGLVRGPRGVAMPLPAGPADRVVTLVRQPDGWVVRAVRRS